VTRGRRPTVFFTAEHQRRAADAGQQAAGIGSSQQRTNLRGKDVGGAAREHVDDAVHQLCVAESQFPHHALHPARRHGGHALVARDLQQFMTAGHFALAGLAGCEWRDAGIQQRECGDSLRRTPQDFHGDAAAHGVAGEGETRRRLAQYFRRHVAQRVERVIDSDGNRRAGAQCTAGMCPDGGITDETRKQDDRRASPIVKARRPGRSVVRACRCDSSRARRVPRAAPKMRARYSWMRGVALSFTSSGVRSGMTHNMA
jgi:hypothetical protein